MTTDPQILAALQRIGDKLDAIDSSLGFIAATLADLDTRDSVRNPT